MSGPWPRTVEVASHDRFQHDACGIYRNAGPRRRHPENDGKQEHVEAIVFSLDANAIQTT
jgi:hypothetical protein